jgi:hypothetical protein
MDEVPGVAHYKVEDEREEERGREKPWTEAERKTHILSFLSLSLFQDVGFATSSPGIPPSAELATTSAAAAAAMGMAQFGNANAIFTTATGRERERERENICANVSILGNPLKRAGDSSTDELK